MQDDKAAVCLWWFRSQKGMALVGMARLAVQQGALVTGEAACRDQVDADNLRLYCPHPLHATWPFTFSKLPCSTSNCKLRVQHGA